MKKTYIQKHLSNFRTFLWVLRTSQPEDG